MLMMEIIISQNDNQLVDTENNNLQEINIIQNDNQIISLQNNTAQDIDIHEDENQIILVNDIPVNITNVLVNGVSVVSNGIAYITVPTKTSELINNSNYISNETDPTVPNYVKEISLADINNWNNKQNELISGTNIKTINSTSLLGSGNINITGNTYTAGNGININSSNEISNTITSYNDLTDLPTIPTKTSDLTNDSDFVTSDYLTSSLASVAFTGSYDDLVDTPTIPTVNDATLTIQQNGTNVQTFTANQSTNATANIIVPTNTSDLSNDSGFISESDYASSLHGGTIKAGVNSYDINSVGQLYAETQTYADYGTIANTNFIGKGTLENVLSGKGYITNSVNNLTNYTLSSNLSTVATSGDYNDLTNKPTIPVVNNWQKITITIIDNNINTNRTFLYVNESLRLAYLQIYLNAIVGNGGTGNLISFPSTYQPIVHTNDYNWFVTGNSNGGNATGRGRFSTSGSTTYVQIYTNTTSLTYPFASIMYPY